MLPLFLAHNTRLFLSQSLWASLFNVVLPTILAKSSHGLRGRVICLLSLTWPGISGGGRQGAGRGSSPAVESVVRSPTIRLSTPISGGMLSLLALKRSVDIREIS